MRFAAFVGDVTRPCSGERERDRQAKYKREIYKKKKTAVENKKRQSVKRNENKKSSIASRARVNTSAFDTHTGGPKKR